MKDKYLRIEYCCKWPNQTLVWEPTMGYEPFIYCDKCNKAQYFEEEEVE